MKYYMIITYPHTFGTQVLMTTGDKAIAADEENKHLLITMGERLLNENVISSYQLVQTVGSEVNRITKAQDMLNNSEVPYV